jgi:hypothetical protein
MKRLNGQLQFYPTTRVNIMKEPFTDTSYVPANRMLFFTGFYRVGNLKTDLNHDVLALEFIPTAIDLMLLEPIPGTQEGRKIIDKHPHTKVLDAIGMPHSEIIPEYNCHGLCFANSIFRIPDANVILADEYTACNEKDAQYVVFYENNVTVHSAERNILTGNYKAKSGYRGLKEVNRFEDAITQEINHDRHQFYRKNTEPNKAYNDQSG